MQFMKGLVAK